MFWKVTTGLCLALAIGAGAWGYTQFQSAEQNAALLTASQSQASQLQSQVSDLEVQTSQLQQRLAGATTELKAEVKPDLPISVGFRRALLGSGLVAVFRNNSAATLEVSAIFMSPATGAHSDNNLVISPNGVKQFGHTEGWAFTAGQRISLSNSNFRPIEITVPGR